MSLRLEIETNFDDFTNSWRAGLPNVIASLDSHRPEFLHSYSRIVSLNTWHGNILENAIPSESREFFAEALNDAMTSHVAARFGSWRSALMSLRSCIENACYCLYYKDHPIELRLWGTGDHRPGFSEIYSYLKTHPDIKPLGSSHITGMTILKTEYGTLSRAVHASAKSFRMAPTSGGTILWKASATSLAQWAARERQTLLGLNLLLMTVFRETLQGAQQQSLRKALGLIIPSTLHARVKQDLNIRILSV
jgi:hypothetical protein